MPRRLPKGYADGCRHTAKMIYTTIDQEIEALKRNAKRPGRAAEQLAADKALLYSLMGLSKLLKDWKPTISFRLKNMEVKVDEEPENRADA